MAKTLFPGMLGVATFMNKRVGNSFTTCRKEIATILLAELIILSLEPEIFVDKSCCWKDLS